MTHRDHADHDVDGASALLDRLRALADTTSVGLFVVDGDDRTLFANRALGDLFDLDDSVVAPGLLSALRDQAPRAVITDGDPANGRNIWSGEIGLRTPDGISRTLEVDLLVERDSGGRIAHWGGVVRDVTDSRLLQSELLRQATHDALTDLPNRLRLVRAAADAIDHHRGGHERVAMLFLDVDRLKDVNDTIGHDAGDQLLVHVASRIAQATRPSDLVARIGGDEFVVLCVGEIDEHTALELAERIRAGLGNRAVVGGLEVDMSVSIGVALATPDLLAASSGEDAAIELLRQADLAMYHAKRQGPSRSEVYSNEMLAAARRENRLGAELADAIAEQQFRLAYQPILSTHSGRVAGAEALLRWEHPDHGTLLPSQFLRIAEETGRMLEIGAWVLRQACRDAASWLAAGLVERSFSVHVNLSTRELVDVDIVDRVTTTIGEAGLLTHQVTLDVDESALDGRHPTAQRNLQALRRLGVHIGLDGFGAGVSSLTALRSCPADLLKLDGSVARLLTGGDDDPVVRAIVQLAHALDMQVVAEWVTSPDQLQRLRLLGCDFVQGHLVGEPTPVEGLTARLSTRRGGPDTHR